MQQKIFFIFLFAIMTLSSAPVQAEDVVYVQSFKAKVLSAPSFKAKVLGEAVKGSKLVSLGKTGNWVKVSIAAQEGYVSSLLVSSRPPLDRQRLIKSEDTEIAYGVRRRASTFTSAAAARGLTHEDRKRASADEEVDYNAVAKMEAFSVTEDEVAKFSEGGRP